MQDWWAFRGPSTSIYCQKGHFYTIYETSSKNPSSLYFKLNFLDFVLFNLGEFSLTIFMNFLKSVISTRSGVGLLHFAACKAAFILMPGSSVLLRSFLTSVSYSLPIVLMVAWVVFIAAFVKKLVYEKDLRLHEVCWKSSLGVNRS